MYFHAKAGQAQNGLSDGGWREEAGAGESFSCNSMKAGEVGAAVGTQAGNLDPVKAVLPEAVWGSGSWLVPEQPHTMGLW